MQEEMVQDPNKPMLPFDRDQAKKGSHSSKNSLQESFEMTSMSSDSGRASANPRNSRLEQPDHEMTDELSIHTSMLRGYGETKLQNSSKL
jgi:hypothetical protein